MWGADDPCDRMPMVWQELSFDSQQADPLGRPRPANPVAFDDGLFKFYQAADKSPMTITVASADLIEPSRTPPCIGTAP